MHEIFLRRTFTEHSIEHSSTPFRSPSSIPFYFVPFDHRHSFVSFPFCVFSSLLLQFYLLHNGRKRRGKAPLKEGIWRATGGEGGGEVKISRQVDNLYTHSSGVGKARQSVASKRIILRKEKRSDAEALWSPPANIFEDCRRVWDEPIGWSR